AYLGAYCFYVTPAEQNERAGVAIIEPRLEVSTGSSKIKIQYAVPSDPGLVNVKVYDLQGNVAYKFMDKARQRQGIYKLTTKKLPRRIYLVDYKIGNKHLAEKVSLFSEAADADISTR
ncbi:MAG: hypothetical protein WC717_06265, partial [Candidatus Micrarchaeia archaeon]